MNRRRLITGLSCSALSVPTLIQPATAETVHGASATGGDRFMVGEQEFVLTDIIAPSAYDLQRSSEPFFEEARSGFAKLINSRALEVTQTDTPNRWGAKRVSAKRAGEEKTLQEMLVDIGVAKVAPHTDDDDFIERLLVSERTARAEKRGLWALRNYRIFEATNARGAIGGYHLVGGTVHSASLAGGRYYLNFGEDFRKDFTATAPSRTGKKWVRIGLDLLSLQGARIRVRGFAVWINGPSIELDHIKQIEVL